MQEDNYEYVLSGAAAPDFILRLFDGTGNYQTGKGRTIRLYP